MLEKGVGLIAALSLHHRAHDRGRGFGYGAAGADEGHIADGLAVQIEIDRVVISAKRVIALDLAGRRRQLVKVSGVPVVVENDLLVELAEIGHQRKTSMTFSSPRTSASTPSRVL